MHVFTSRNRVLPKYELFKPKVDCTTCWTMRSMNVQQTHILKRTVMVALLVSETRFWFVFVCLEADLFSYIHLSIHVDTMTSASFQLGSG